MSKVVALVPGCEYFLQGDVDFPPPCSAVAEFLDCRLSTRMVLCVSGNQVSNRLAMPCDGKRLAAFHLAEKLGKMCTGLSSLDFTHGIYNQLF